MIEIKLLGIWGKGKIALIDDCDSKFAKFKWYVTRQGYVIRYHNYHGRTRLHNELLGISSRITLIDHINRNKLDNRRENLRICNKAQNTINSPANKNNTSGYKGVTFCKKNGKWKAQLKVNYKNLNLGYRLTKIEAAKLYNEKAKEYFGEFAYMNDCSLNL